MNLLTQQSEKEFTSARHQALIAEWTNYFTGRPNDLLSFEEVKQNLRLQDSSYKGLQEIELDKIVGSTGRYRDFNRAFLPKTSQTEDRWRRVDAVTHSQGAPPIDVYKVGDVYFVRDGNHRVSVARTHKAKTIEAYVTEYKTPVPITKDDDLDDILLRLERAEFFSQTHLDEIRPEQTVVFTEPGRYRLIREHIMFHKYVKETECGCEIPYEEAVASWYDNVYLPVIELIHEHKVMKDFPDRTEADLYAWLMLHRAQIEGETDALGYAPIETLIESVKRERATNPFARMMGLLRHTFDFKNLPLQVERAKFLEQTQLDRIRPDHDIHFTEPGCYQLAKEHINGHKYLRESELGHNISYEEAVASWYDHVYMPVVELIRERDLLKNFPKNTEGDIYIWVVSRRKQLEDEQQAMGQIPTERLIWDLENEISSKSILGLTQLFGQRLDLKSIVENHD